MKKLILAVLVLTGVLGAADYSSMSTEELAAMRGSVAAEDREAFRAEMQSRMSQMTPEQRAEFQRGGKSSMKSSAGRGGGQGMGNKGANRGGGRR